MMRNIVVLMFLLVGLIALSSGNLLAQERWVYRYNGPGAHRDYAHSIALGADGNLYAAGESRGSGTYSDFTVISLTPSGGERWVYRYNGPGNEHDRLYSIATGADSNLYVAGPSEGTGTGLDFTVISLAPSGGERWVYRYNGPSYQDDLASSVVVGADDNVYAAGATYESPGSPWDFTVISLTPSGGERWVYSYNGPANGVDWANSIVMGADSNLYAAGHSDGSGTSWDFTVISLSPSGGERWVYCYNGPGNDYDDAHSIAMGADGNLYAAGYSWGTGTGIDLTVISLAPSGSERWVYSYNGPGNGHDWANSIATGADGNLYAAGASEGSGSDYDFTVISLDTSGGERWVYRYDGPADSIQAAYSIVIGADGNLYAAGEILWGSGTEYDFIVISVTPSGGERWVYRYNGPADSSDGALSIVRGGEGNLYAAGFSTGSGTGRDFTVISLSPDVGVEEKPDGEGRVREARLQLSALPTPALAGVNIHYYLPQATEIQLTIYDGSGRLVKKLVNAAEEIGSKSVFWDGTNESGNEVSGGTYFCRLTQGDLAATTKLILLR